MSATAAGGLSVDSTEPGGVAARTSAVRARILDAAVTALIDHGYAGATTLRIQAIAGVSRGRLLHHYPSREQLLVAAVAHLATARIHALSREISLPDDLGARSDVAVATMWTTYRQPHFWAASELWLAARTDDALAEALLPAERAVQREVLAETRGLFGPVLVARERFEDLVRVLNTSMRGAALAYAFVREREHADEPLLESWRVLSRRELGLPPR